MKHFFLIFLMMFVSTFASAQTVEVSGVVKDLQQKPVADVIVKVVAGKSTIAFVTTSAKGEYALSFDAKKAKGAEAVVTFTHIAYEKEYSPLQLPQPGERSRPDGKSHQLGGLGGRKAIVVDMILEPKTIELKEVKVKANPLFLMGDTLSYNLATFLKKGDVTLEDGLKNLPGITISESGMISYMGKGISEFQIEGLNMLDGRYNLATKNIPAEYATQVEVMKHHKSRRIDADEESDNVAINVKLSKKAKFKPFGQPIIGIGIRPTPPQPSPQGEGVKEFPSTDVFVDNTNNKTPSLCGEGRGGGVLGALGLTGMMFTDRFQLLGSAKWSNHGDFGSYDLTDHFGGIGVGSLATDKLGKWGGGASPIGEYSYQKNGYASLNGIEKIDTFRTVKANADYSFEERRNSFSTQTLYFADGTNIGISETQRPMTRLHRPTMSVTYENNAPDRYLRDIFMAKAQFEENECPVMTTSLEGGAAQDREATVFQFSNSLWSSVLVGKKKLSFVSYVDFNRAPSVVLTMNDIRQAGQSTTLNTHHQTSVKLKLTKKWSINLPLTLDANYKMIDCFRELNSQRVSGWRISPSTNLTSSWKWAGGKAYASAGVCLQWTTMTYDALKSSYSRFFVEPTAFFRYTFSGTSEMTLSSGVSNSSGDILDLITVPVQTSYRTTSVASGVIGESQSWATVLTYKKQVPFSYFTFGANASWNMGKRNVLSAQTVSGTAVESSSIFRDSHSRSANGGVSVSKNILPLTTKLNLDANIYWGSSEQMSQGKFVTSYSSRYDVAASADITPVGWMELNAKGNYGKSFTRFVGQRSAFDSMSTSGSVAFFPIATVELRANIRYVHSQIADERYKDASILSASAQYKAKRAVWKLMLNNLLNTRHYTYTVQSATDRFTHDINLIGRTVMITCVIRTKS